MHDLPDFKLEVHFSRWEFAARYHLTASDAETITLAELLALGSEEDRSRFASQPLGYTPTWGSPQLLEAVADTYTQLEPEHVLGFTGAEEAMFWALQELVGPDDHAIVTVPNYQSMETLVLSTDASVDALPLRAEKDWALELDVLEGLLRPNTKLVAVNFPNNPTGAVPDQASFRRLVEICEENSIWLFSDEVFRGLELDSSTTLPQAADISATAISLNVMSKSYGLPGLRIGWLASRDRALLERLERRKHYTSICSSGPSEQLAGIIVQGPLELVPPEELRRQFEINTLGPVHVVQALLPLLRTGRGRIVNISAPTARVPVPFTLIGASKAALASVSDSLRLELAAWDIPVIVIEPVGTNTAIFRKAESAARDALAAADPAKVALYSDQLAAVAKATAKQKLGPVDPIAKTVVAAVQARKPKRRYTAGSGAAIFGALAHAPTGLRASHQVHSRTELRDGRPTPGGAAARARDACVAQRMSARRPSVRRANRSPVTTARLATKQKRAVQPIRTHARSGKLGPHEVRSRGLEDSG